MNYIKRYILTGSPGCGKSSIIKALKMHGTNVITEAATDIINCKQLQGIDKPWEHKNFIDDIVKLQKHRQLELIDDSKKLYFYDRSPICTYALAMYLNFKPSLNLTNEIERIKKHDIYNNQVFFIDNLGTIEKTNARQISFEEALKFEKTHLDVYSQFGFNCIHIPKISVENRAKLILEHANYSNV